MANVDQKNLIPLCILEVLKKYSDPEHPLTHNMIADHLVEDYSISPRPERKSIGRNLENLKTQMDIDIEITPKGSYLVCHDFEDYEIRLLIDSVLSNKYISAIETRELVSKLKGLTGVYFESYEEHLLTIDEKRKTDKRDLYLKLQVINDAIEGGCDLCFELDEQADYPNWMITRDVIEQLESGRKFDPFEKDDRKARIKPEYLILLNHRYYVAFKTIIQKFPADYFEVLAYCGLDEINNLSIEEHEPYQLPEGFSLAGKTEVSKEAVREMISRDVIERPGSKKFRADFLIDPAFLKKTEAALGEAVLIKDYPGVIPQIRVIIDVDRNTFERFWWNNLTEIRLLGPEHEISWLKYLLAAAKETMEDADAFKKILGI